MTKSFKIVLAYDGAAYLGWQIQAEGATIQAEVLGSGHLQTQRDVQALVTLYEEWGRRDEATDWRARVVG